MQHAFARTVGIRQTGRAEFGLCRIPVQYHWSVGKCFICVAVCLSFTNGTAGGWNEDMQYFRAEIYHYLYYWSHSKQQLLFAAFCSSLSLLNRTGFLWEHQVCDSLYNLVT